MLRKLFDHLKKKPKQSEPESQSRPFRTIVHDWPSITVDPKWVRQSVELPIVINASTDAIGGAYVPITGTPFSQGLYLVCEHCGRETSNLDREECEGCGASMWEERRG